MRGRKFFEGLHETLLTVPLGTVILVKMPKDVHPEQYGAKRSTGLSKGQLEDWRFPPDDAGQGMHLHKYHDHWSAHLDRWHPEANMIEHLRYDAPGVYMGVMGAVGGLLGFVLAPEKERVEYTWSGVLLGSLAGYITRRTDDQQFLPTPTSPDFSRDDRLLGDIPRAGERCRLERDPGGLDWRPYG